MSSKDSVTAVRSPVFIAIGAVAEWEVSMAVSDVMAVMALWGGQSPLSVKEGRGGCSKARQRSAQGLFVRSDPGPKGSHCLRGCAVKKVKIVERSFVRG